MATLVGDDTTRAGSISSDNSSEFHFACGGFTASATGSATTAFIRVANAYSTTGIKVGVYGSTGTLLGSATITSMGTGWRSASLDAAIEITQGNVYILGWIATPANQYLVVYHDGTSSNLHNNTSGDYATLPSTITPRTEGTGNFAAGKPSIYLDGTAGGAGLSIPKLMRYYQRMRTS
jgi:hypothetical protein